MDKNNENNKKSFASMKNIFVFSIAPRKHFKKIITISFFVFLCLGAFDAYVFYQVKYFDLKESDRVEVVPIPVVNENKLKTILNRYDQKAKIQSSVANTLPSIVDPSK